MVSAARLGERLGYTEAGTAARIETVLRAYRLPVSADVSRDAFAEILSRDKKSLGNEIRFVFLKRIGEAQTVPLAKEALLQLL